VIRAVIVLTLIAIIGLPFALRPKRVAAQKADDTVVIITPHNEAIRHEYARGFAEWYRARTGRTVAIDWRVVGGTSDIARFLEGEYTGAFENYWTNKLGRPWSAEIQAGFQNGKLPANAPAIVKEARAAFLASEVSCGIDVFFGGGTYDLDRQALAGRLVDSGLLREHPEWFSDDVIPQRFRGEDYWRIDGLWFGTVLSSYGIIFSRDSFKRLGIEREPAQWSDLMDPRLLGEVGLADPTKSGSVAKAFENIIQQQMQRRLKTVDEPQAVRDGWNDGMKIIQLIGANARYFTDTSQKPPIDVAAGNCAAGLCIDFYGRQQQEAVRRRGSGMGVPPMELKRGMGILPVNTADHGRDAHATSDRIGYVSPAGGSVASVDPIALMRGAPNRRVATAFIEYSISMEGQKLWNLKPGTAGGPERFALRRMPVRRDFYEHAEWRPLRSDPDDSPFDSREPLVYREAWTRAIFREMAFVIRVMCQDTHTELVSAWRAIIAAPEPAKARALAALQDLSAVDYARTSQEIRARLGSKDKVDEVRLARELGEHFRAIYARAEAIAREWR
jgi:iron(III) transport system substrate-binding protein